MIYCTCEKGLSHLREENIASERTSGETYHKCLSVVHVLSGVPQRSAEVSPRQANTIKHKGLMATLRRNIHSLQEVQQ